MTLDAASIQSSLAGQLIQAVMGQAQQVQTDLAMKLARISLSQNIQSQSTANLNSAGSVVDTIV